MHFYIKHMPDITGGMASGDDKGGPKRMYPKFAVARDGDVRSTDPIELTPPYMIQIGETGMNLGEGLTTANEYL